MTTRASSKAAAMLCCLLLAATATACRSANDGAASGGSTVAAGNDNVIENSEKPTPGGKLVYGLIAETNGWNPGSSQWAPSGQQVAKTIFDTLSAYDADGKIQPFLAERFDHSPNYDEWTITIREGVKLHNGKPVTAETIRRDQQFLKDSTLTKSVYDRVDGFTVKSPRELVVKLKERWVSYPYSLSTQVGVVVDPDWLESKDTRAPIGTGPFKLKSWVPDKSMVLERNPDYWQKGYPLLDEIEYQPIPDENSRKAALDAGDIDMMEVTDARSIKHYKDDADTKRYQVFNATSGESSEVFVMLNTMNSPLDDPEARLALAYATDAKAYNDTLNEGLFELATGPFSKSSPWYADSGYPQYDLAKAKDLVAKVKARHGGQFTFKLIGPPTPTVTEGLQLLKQQWEAAGIAVQIETMQQLTLIVTVIGGTYQATFWQQFDSPHPVSDSIWWHPRSAFPLDDKEHTSLNFARNKDDAIGAALDTARGLEDPAAEKAQYAIVQQRMAQDLPYIWLYHSQISIVAHTDLVNVTSYTLPTGQKGLPITQGAHPVWQIWRKK